MKLGRGLHILIVAIIQKYVFCSNRFAVCEDGGRANFLTRRLYNNTFFCKREGRYLMSGAKRPSRANCFEWFRAPSEEGGEKFWPEKFWPKVLTKARPYAIMSSVAYPSGMSRSVQPVPISQAAARILSRCGSC